MAATADETTLSLWQKGPGDTAYSLQATTPIVGSFYNSSPGLDDAWVAGRIRWAGVEQDLMKGRIDEVRLTAAVLPSSAFLASSSVTNPDSDNDGMADAWETTYFGGLAQTATGDFDSDGTNNLTEYRLGLVPTSGSSRFAAVRGAGGALTWPSVAGLTFTIQRSTTLGGWTDVGTVTATGTTASWTDTSPPAGATKVFYRVALP